MTELSTLAVIDRPGPAPMVEIGGSRPARRLWARIIGELVIVVAFGGVYELLRTDMVQDGTAAARHAIGIVRLESALGLFHEQAIQRLFLRVPDLVKGCNLYYGGTHFVVPAAALIWLAIRHPDHYGRARTSLAVTTGLAFVAFWLYPVAPPRLLPARFGIIDTLVTFQQSGHLEHTLVDSAGDIYAATPSLHVAWALWVTLALYPVVSHTSLRVLLVAYPLATSVVVIATGNHFVFDVACGAGLVVTVWALTPQWTRRISELVRRGMDPRQTTTDGPAISEELHDVVGGFSDQAPGDSAGRSMTKNCSGRATRVTHCVHTSTGSDTPSRKRTARHGS